MQVWLQQYYCIFLITDSKSLSLNYSILTEDAKLETEEKLDAAQGIVEEQTNS